MHYSGLELLPKRTLACEFCEEPKPQQKIALRSLLPHGTDGSNTSQHAIFFFLAPVNFSLSRFSDHLASVSGRAIYTNMYN